LTSVEVGANVEVGASVVGETVVEMQVLELE